MNKKYLLAIIAIMVIIAVYFKQNIINNTLFIFNKTKETIQTYRDYIKTAIYIHFNQANQIKILLKYNKEYQDYIAKITPLLKEYEQLKKFKNLYIKNAIFAQTISYANLPDMTSIYINYKDSNITTPKGLVYNNTAAGIVVKNIKDFSLAYLNSNIKTSYTVFIGKNKIPGVLFGGNKIIIKYIPKYKPIKKGDLVITSGLDKIFYEGVKVGKVKQVLQKDLYQEVIITPFYDSLHPNLFYVVKIN